MNEHGIRKNLLNATFASRNKNTIKTDLIAIGLTPEQAQNIINMKTSENDLIADLTAIGLTPEQIRNKIFIKRLKNVIERKTRGSQGGGKRTLRKRKGKKGTRKH